MKTKLIAEISVLIEKIEIENFWSIASLNFENRKQFFEYISTAKESELERIKKEFLKFLSFFGDLS